MDSPDRRGQITEVTQDANSDDEFEAGVSHAQIRTARELLAEFLREMHLSDLCTGEQRSTVLMMDPSLPMWHLVISVLEYGEGTKTLPSSRPMPQNVLGEVWEMQLPTVITPDSSPSTTPQISSAAVITPDNSRPSGYSDRTPSTGTPQAASKRQPAGASDSQVSTGEDDRRHKSPEPSKRQWRDERPSKNSNNTAVKPLSTIMQDTATSLPLTLSEICEWLLKAHFDSENNASEEDSVLDMSLNEWRRQQMEERDWEAVFGSAQPTRPVLLLEDTGTSMSKAVDLLLDAPHVIDTLPLVSQDRDVVFAHLSLAHMMAFLVEELRGERFLPLFGLPLKATGCSPEVKIVLHRVCPGCVTSVLATDPVSVVLKIFARTHIGAIPVVQPADESAVDDAQNTEISGVAADRLHVIDVFTRRDLIAWLDRVARNDVGENDAFPIGLSSSVSDFLAHIDLVYMTANAGKGNPNASLGSKSATGTAVVNSRETSEAQDGSGNKPAAAAWSAFTGPYDNNRAQSLLVPNRETTPRGSLGGSESVGREGLSSVLLEESIKLSDAIVRLLMTDSGRLFFVSQVEGCSHAFIIRRLVTVSDLWRLMLGGDHHAEGAQLPPALASPCSVKKTNSQFSQKSN